MCRRSRWREYATCGWWFLTRTDVGVCLRARAAEQRPALEEQLTQHRAVASGFIGAVATDRKIGLMGQGRKNIQHGGCVSGGHFSPVFLEEANPVPQGWSRHSLSYRRG